MATIELKPNYDEKELSRQAETFPKAGVSAINRIAREGRGRIAQAVSNFYNIKRKEALDKMTITPATQRNLVARINSKSRGMTVMRFDARESALARGTVVQITRNSSKTIRNAFINRVPTGGYKGKLVLARLGKGRYPLEAIRTISITTMIGTKKVAADFRELINTRLPEELTRLIKLWGK